MCSFARPLTEKSLAARSCRVPPHFSPRAISSHLSLSKPSDSNSAAELNANRSTASRPRACWEKEELKPACNYQLCFIYKEVLFTVASPYYRLSPTHHSTRSSDTQGMLISYLDSNRHRISSQILPLPSPKMGPHTKVRANFELAEVAFELLTLPWRPLKG